MKIMLYNSDLVELKTQNSVFYFLNKLPRRDELNKYIIALDLQTIFDFACFIKCKHWCFSLLIY